jgi:transcription factor SPN1
MCPAPHPPGSTGSRGCPRPGWNRQVRATDRRTTDRHQRHSQNERGARRLTRQTGRTISTPRRHRGIPAPPRADLESRRLLASAADPPLHATRRLLRCRTKPLQASPSFRRRQPRSVRSGHPDPRPRRPGPRKDRSRQGHSKRESAGPHPARRAPRHGSVQSRTGSRGSRSTSGGWRSSGRGRPNRRPRDRRRPAVARAASAVSRRRAATSTGSPGDRR